MPRLTIVFDQDCGVCQASVAWLKRRDINRAFLFVGNRAPALPQGVPADETGETIFVVDEASGTIRTRADGIAWLLRTLPGWRSIGWRMLGALIPIPGIRQLANLGYRIFAKHRHRVSAALGLSACDVPDRPNAGALKKPISRKA